MRLAFKELARSRLRFGLLAGAVSLLVFLLLFLNTLSGTLLGFFTGAVENSSAEVLVYDAGARRNLQASRLDPAVVDGIAQVPGVSAAAGLAETTVTARAGQQERTDLSLWGFVPGQPGEPTRIVEGRLPGPGEAIVDRADAGNGFRIGETITLEPSGRTLEIVGHTADSRFSVIATAYTTLQEWQGILTAQNPGASVIPFNAVAVALDDPASAQRVAARIVGQVPGVDALTRDAAVAAIPGARSIAQSFALLVGITFTIVVLVVGFFFLILTVQKLRTFVVLRALGAPTSYLAGALVTQIVVLVAAGVVLATALLGVAALTSSESFPIGVDPALVLTVMIAVLLCSALTGLVSVRRIARLDAAQAAQIR